MGNQSARAVKGIDQIVGPLMGANMLSVLKNSIQSQKVFNTIFGDRIFVNELPSYNETILPAWEFRFSKETIQGGDLRQPGVINSRILFPNNLQGDLDFHRNVALAVGRYFDSRARITDVLEKVSGLTEIGQDLDITYDTLFVHGAIQLPSVIMKIPFVFDIRRFRLENPEIPLDEELDTELAKQWEQRLTIIGVDDVGDTSVVLINEEKLS